MKQFIFFLIFVAIASCSNNKTEYKQISFYSETPEYDDWASEQFLWNRDFILDSVSSSKSGVGETLTGRQCKYFMLDSLELENVKSGIGAFLAHNDTLHPLEHYYRQYIGFRQNNEKYAYINFFAYYHRFGDLIPDIYHSIYSPDSTGYNFGYIYMNMESNEIIEAIFKP